MTIQTIRRKRHPLSLGLSLLLLLSPLGQLVSRGQTAVQQQPAETTPPEPAQILRLERVEVPGGSELITIHARLVGLETEENDKWVPLVSTLRDTLGDTSPENDRLRYVWPLTYARPTLKQRLAAAVPFLYTRVGNNERTSEKPPPPAFDLGAPDREVWDKIFWTALQNILLDPYGTAVKASTSSYRKNTTDYRRSHIIRALAVLALYQAVKGEATFSPAEMAEIQARLMLSEKTFGGLVDALNLQSYYSKRTAQTRDERGHNWELLRQSAEAESLYFEPLLMPDGSATHAMLWIAKRDLEKRHGARYDGRFLNIANPWSDQRLLKWQGYVETRYFDSESHPVAPDTPGAQDVELIPLALYGLDYPKIPMLLVDFRDGLNPKKREMSRRALNDVTRNILSLSKFGSLPYFLGRTVLDFVTGRRGIDFNQPSRLQTYSQLKLLLALNDSMEPRLRAEVSERLEKVSLNPLENDLQAEARLACRQYQALLAFAKNPEGLAAKIERDRRSELTSLEHGSGAQAVFRFLRVLTFGRYVHREELTANMDDRLDVARRLNHHTRFLEQVVNSSAEVEIVWNLEEVKRSLHYISEHGLETGDRTVAAAVKLFMRTKDDETRRACLESLSRIANPKARNELIRISQNKAIDQGLRDVAAAYIRQPNRSTQPIASVDTGSPVKAGQP